MNIRNKQDHIKGHGHDFRQELFFPILMFTMFQHSLGYKRVTERTVLSYVNKAFRLIYSVTLHLTEWQSFIP